METKGSVVLLYDSSPELLSWKTCQRLMIEFIIRAFLVPYYLSSILLLPCYIMTAALIVVCENIAGFVQLIERNSRVIRSDGPSSVPAKTITINDVPCEILVHIFTVIREDRSSDVSAACLGLTCTSFYRVFKTVYSYTVDLATSSGIGRRLDPDDWAADDLNVWPGSYWSHITLGDLLADFMGAKYRKTTVNWKQVYLPIAVYGEFEGLAQTRLEQRYQDYQSIWYWEPWSTSYNYLYPDPRIDDKEWYLRAEKITRGLERELENRNGVKFGNDLDNFVKTHFYKQRKEDRMWEGFREWAEMVNI